MAHTARISKWTSTSRCVGSLSTSDGADAINKEIAGFFADATLDESGRTFVALFGSVDHYVGRKPTPSDNGFGWCPSDVMGLYAILRATLDETDEAKLDADYLWDDGRQDSDSRIEVAYRFWRQLKGEFPSEHVTVLAKSFIQRDDYDLGGTHYDTVLLGAPVWIATPLPRQMTGWRRGKD